MFFEELIPLIILASVPVVGVVGWTLVKMTEQIFGQNKVSNRDVQHLLDKLATSEKETTKLKNRLENLEVILTAMDSESVDNLLNSHEYETQESDTQKIEQFAQNLKGAKKRLDKASVTEQDSKEESVQNNLKGVVNKLLTKIDVYLDEQEMKNRLK